MNSDSRGSSLSYEVVYACVMACEPNLGPEEITS